MKTIFRPFPMPLTGKQLFYLGFLQGIGAGFIDGGVNFAVAYAMYHDQSVVKMWVFSQNTIAGDLGVTPIIQCIASMLITSALVHSDLHHSQIKPLPFVYPHVEHLPDPRSLFEKKKVAEITNTKGDAEKTVVHQKQKHGFTYYFWMLVRFIFEGTEQNMLLAKPGFGAWWGRLAWTAAQGAAIGIVFGFPLWCLAVTILGPIYGTRNMGNKWAPQVIKLIYGAIVGWVTNPVIATLALGSQSEHHLLIVEHPSIGDEEATVTGHTERGLEVIADEDAIDLAPPNTAFNLGESPTQSRRSSIRMSMGQNSTLGLTTSTSPQLVLGRQMPTTPGRPRAHSGSGSHRSFTPLTANVHSFSPVPQPGSASLIPPAGRLRGATLSSIPNPSPATQYSYALGGTGGRAKRSGSIVSGSAIPISTTATPRPSIPVFNTTQGLGFDTQQDGTLQQRIRAGSVGVDVFGRRESAPAGAGAAAQPANDSLRPVAERRRTKSGGPQILSIDNAPGDST